MALPAGLSPATTTFEASYSDTLSYGSVEIGGPPRIRTVFWPVKSRDFTAKVCSRKPFAGWKFFQTITGAVIKPILEFSVWDYLNQELICRQRTRLKRAMRNWSSR